MQHKTTIKDASGEDHVYTCIPFDFDESIALTGELGVILGAGFDKSISGAFGAFLAQGGAKLIRRILANTARDGVKLSDPASFGIAYANTGNMLECYQAVGWVVAKCILPFGSGLPGLGSLTDVLSLLPEMLTKTTDSPPSDDSSSTE
jgi:hypothetical protein